MADREHRYTLTTAWSGETTRRRDHSRAQTVDLASQAQLSVVEYRDEPTGIMIETASGAGQFTMVTLNPTVTVTNAAHRDTASTLHAAAHEMCFIARSVAFPVRCRDTVIVAA